MSLNKTAEFALELEELKPLEREAYQFYSIHSWEAGFSIRLGRNHFTRNRKNRRLIKMGLLDEHSTKNMQEFVCSRADDQHAKESSLKGIVVVGLIANIGEMRVVAWTSKTKSNPSRRFVKCAKRVVCKVWFWEDLIHQYVDDLVDYFIDAKTQLIEESNQTLQVQVDEKTNLLLKLQDDILTAYGQLEEETSKLRQSEEQRQILQSRVTAIERKLLRSRGMAQSYHIDNSEIAPFNSYAGLILWWTQMANEMLKVADRDEEIDDDAEEGQIFLRSESGEVIRPTSRSSVKKVSSLIAKMNQEKRDIIEEIGFGGLLRLPHLTKVDRGFTFWLLSNVDCESRKILVPGRDEVTMDDAEVQRCLGIPRGKRVVCGLGRDNGCVKLDFIQFCIGAEQEQSNSLLAAKSNVEERYEDGMSDIEKSRFEVSFVVFVLGYFLAPTTKCNHGSDSFWGALKNPEEIKDYHRCQYVLDSLIDAARKAQADIQAKRKCSMSLAALCCFRSCSCTTLIWVRSTFHTVRQFTSYQCLQRLTPSLSNSSTLFCLHTTSFLELAFNNVMDDTGKQQISSDPGGSSSVRGNRPVSSSVRGNLNVSDRIEEGRDPALYGFSRFANPTLQIDKDLVSALGEEHAIEFLKHQMIIYKTKGFQREADPIHSSDRLLVGFIVFQPKFPGGRINGFIPGGEFSDQASDWYIQTHPTVIKMSGSIIRRQFIEGGSLYPETCRALIRLFQSEDGPITGVQRWRHFLPPDFTSSDVATVKERHGQPAQDIHAGLLETVNHYFPEWTINKDRWQFIYHTGIGGSDQKKDSGWCMLFFAREFNGRTPQNSINNEIDLYTMSDFLPSSSSIPSCVSIDASSNVSLPGDHKDNTNTSGYAADNETNSSSTDSSYEPNSSSDDSSYESNSSSDDLSYESNTLEHDIRQDETIDIPIEEVGDSDDAPDGTGSYELAHGDSSF
uniref:Uncharacterized protein n=1 Tax=Leersia perrieri TaxID=77586 RepID=A0A0D9XBC6_9ORYZ